jgi:pseudouridine-5'-phosphate glycosidase
MLGAFVSLLLLPLASGSELRIHPEVQRALAERRPVVALESTIISHGMPYPDNLRTAREVEEVVRSCGATPATIAILDGVCCIGLADEELERFAQLGSAGEVRKVSRRDLAHAVARNAHGGTTVSSTMLLAHKAGIAVFVTGGIGGVHRGGESSMDVSADLVELGRTPVLVVSAGIKSILDIPRTLEYLETQGVAVLALGTDEFPAFFTRSSGCAAPMVASGCAEAAAVCHTQLDRLRLQSGLLVGVPIPAEAEAEAEVVQLAIQQALADAEAAGVGGRDTTPYLLRRVAELTQGRSLAANIALVKNNARHGAQIASSLAALRAADGGDEADEADEAAAAASSDEAVAAGVEGALGRLAGAASDAVHRARELAAEAVAGVAGAAEVAGAAATEAWLGAAGLAVEAVDVLAETVGAGGASAPPVGSKPGMGGATPVPASSIVEKLSELAALRDAGALDDDEFKAAKAQLLAS